MSHQNRDKEEALELEVPLCPENCKISAAATQICSGSNASDAKPDTARVDSPHHLTTVKTDIRGSGSAPPDTANQKKVREIAGAPAVDVDADADAASSKKSVNRCSGCGKRVGLTGFRCRCGDMFCSVHRYSDRHDCNFDYKAAGREAIARENPLVRAAKISRI